MIYNSSLYISFLSLWIEDFKLKKDVAREGLHNMIIYYHCTSKVTMPCYYHPAIPTLPCISWNDFYMLYHLRSVWLLWAYIPVGRIALQKYSKIHEKTYSLWVWKLLKCIAWCAHSWHPYNLYIVSLPTLWHMHQTFCWWYSVTTKMTIISSVRFQSLYRIVWCGEWPPDIPCIYKIYYASTAHVLSGFKSHLMHFYYTLGK